MPLRFSVQMTSVCREQRVVESWAISQMPPPWSIISKLDNTRRRRFARRQTHRALTSRRSDRNSAKHGHFIEAVALRDVTHITKHVRVPYHHVLSVDVFCQKLREDKQSNFPGDQLWNISSGKRKALQITFEKRVF